MRRMYEWGIATDCGGQPRLSPVGVTDDVARAQARMLEALCAIPADVPVTGWVTVMVYVPSLNGYDRFQTPVRVMRTESGEVQWLAGGGGE